MPSPIEHLQAESPQDVPGKKRDRPYECLSCHSYFKLKWHLDSHIKICSTKSQQNLSVKSVIRNSLITKAENFMKKHAKERKNISVMIVT